MKNATTVEEDTVAMETEEENEEEPETLELPEAEPATEGNFGELNSPPTKTCCDCAPSQRCKEILLGVILQSLIVES